MAEWQDKPDRLGFWWAEWNITKKQLPVAVHSIDAIITDRSGTGEVYIPGSIYGYAVEDFSRWHRLERLEE